MNDNQTHITIGQIASMLGITRRIILNYEDHGLITADTRGEFNTGYRYYTMDTLVRIRTIRTYQLLGLSLNEIKSYLDGSTDLVPAIKRLEELRDALNLNIEQLKERAKKNHQITIETVTISSCRVYRKTIRDASIEARTNYLREVAYAAMKHYGADIGKRMYFTEYALDDADLVACCAAVPPESRGEHICELPSGKALVQYHHGSYENLPAVRNGLLAYAKEYGIALSGVCRHVYLEGPPQHQNPENFITMVALFIKE